MPDYRVIIAMDMKAETAEEAAVIARSQLEYMMDVGNDDKSCTAVYVEAKPSEIAPKGEVEEAEMPIIVESLAKIGVNHGN